MPLLLILDFNEDGWPDILVASDGTPSLLYRNGGDGTFEEVGMQAGLVLDAGGAAYAGMGIDAAYPTNDGQLCIAIGNFVGEPTTLHCRVRQGTPTIRRSIRKCRLGWDWPTDAVCDVRAVFL